MCHAKQESCALIYLHLIRSYNALEARFNQLFKCLACNLQWLIIYANLHYASTEAELKKTE